MKNQREINPFPQGSLVATIELSCLDDTGNTPLQFKLQGEMSKPLNRVLRNAASSVDNIDRLKAGAALLENGFMEAVQESRARINKDPNLSERWR